MADLTSQNITENAFGLALAYRKAAERYPDFGVLTSPAQGMVAGAIAQLIDEQCTADPAQFLIDSYEAYGDHPAREIARNLRNEMEAWGVEA